MRMGEWVGGGGGLLLCTLCCGLLTEGIVHPLIFAFFGGGGEGGRGDRQTEMDRQKRKEIQADRHEEKSESWLVGCLTSQQHASVSQGRICSDNFTCCHTEIEVADPTFHLTQSQYTDTGPTSPSADPIMPGAWQGSHWSANFEVTGMTRPRKIPSQAGFEPWIFRSRGGRLNH